MLVSGSVPCDSGLLHVHGGLHLQVSDVPDIMYNKFITSSFVCPTGFDQRSTWMNGKQAF